MSEVLYDVASMAYDEEIAEFKNALLAMKDEQITFFQVECQFELDIDAWEQQ